MIAENRFVLTEDLFRESFGAIQGDYRRFCRRLIAVLALLWLALTAFILYSGKSILIALAELGVLGLVGVYASVYLPRRKAKAAYEAILRRTGPDAERITRFFEDRLEVEIGGQIVTLPYEQIQQRQQTSRLLILLGKDKRGYMIRKDSFTKGSLQAALSAIEKATREETDHD